jgi:hypothetical protein
MVRTGIMRVARAAFSKGMHPATGLIGDAYNTGLVDARDRLSHQPEVGHQCGLKSL